MPESLRKTSEHFILSVWYDSPQWRWTVVDIYQLYRGDYSKIYRLVRNSTAFPVRVQMIQFCSRSTKLRKGEINWVNYGKPLRPSIKHSWHYEKSKLSSVFSSEEHLLLTADWSHLRRSRGKRRTANLTTMNIRQMSAGTSSRMINNWDTLESWKKERNRIFTKQYQCNTNTLINIFFPHRIWNINLKNHEFLLCFHFIFIFFLFVVN